MMIILFLLLLLLVGRVEASVLSDLADTMTADSWATITTNGINIPSGWSTGTLLSPGGSSGNITSDASNGCYDPVLQRAHFIGADHFVQGGVQHGPVHVIYDLASNTWLRQANTPFSYPAGSGANHAWEGNTCDVRGRALYRMNMSSLDLWRLNLDTLAWTNLGAPPGGVMSWAFAFPGQAFHYEMGSRGKLILNNTESTPNGVIAAYDPATNTWTRISVASGYADSVSVAEYSEVHRVTLLGNGTGGVARIMDTRGNLTTIAAYPACQPRINRNGIIHADPVTGNFIMLCGDSTASWHIYNPITNVWTTKATPSTITDHILNANPTSQWPTWGKIGIPISDHGVILYVACNSSSCGTRLYRGGTFTAADRDFKRKAYAPGVIRSVGFDSPNDLLSDGSDTNVTGVTVQGGSPALDNSIRAAGISSLKWTIPAGSDGNSRGYYGTNFMQDMSYQVGPTGQSPANVTNEYWVQARIRVDSTYATSVRAMSIGPKMFWIGAAADRPGAGQTSCTQQEIVMQPSPGFEDVMMVYHGCPGTFLPGSNFLFLRECGPGNPNCTNTLRARELQQGDIINCTYQNASGVTGGSGSRDTCKRQGDNPNTWKTFTAHVKVPSWYANNSVFKHDAILEVWVTEEGGTRQKIINFVNADASCAGQTGTLAPDEICGWDYANTSSGSPSNPVDRIGKLWFTTYSNAIPFPNGGQYWLDNLIISTTDPGDPGAAPPPPVVNAPTQIRITGR